MLYLTTNHIISLPFMLLLPVLYPLSKKSYLLLKKVLYFSDGAASQYKNYKAFINLCFHEQDHNLKAEWHLFARSHRKNPCDAAGGTVKWLVANASLKANHYMCILTPKQLYQWGTKNTKGIFFFFMFCQKQYVEIH